MVLVVEADRQGQTCGTARIRQIPASVSWRCQWFLIQGGHQPGRNHWQIVVGWIRYFSWYVGCNNTWLCSWYSTLLLQLDIVTLTGSLNRGPDLMIMLKWVSFEILLSYEIWLVAVLKHYMAWYDCLRYFALDFEICQGQHCPVYSRSVVLRTLRSFGVQEWLTHGIGPMQVISINVYLFVSWLLQVRRTTGKSTGDFVSRRIWFS